MPLQNSENDLLLSLNTVPGRGSDLEKFYERQTILNRDTNGKKLGWPHFEFEGEVARSYWRKIAICYPECQLLLIDPLDATIKAIGQSISIYWNGTPEALPSGWDGAITLGFKQLNSKIAANTLVPLAITIRSDCQGKGYSKKLLEGMKAISKKMGLRYMIAPVRPMLKSLYPTIAMEKYIRWKNKSGEFFDPWIRTHSRMGARILKIAPKSLIISGTVTEWEQWTNMAFPESGDYVVPEALSTVYIDRTKNHGLYLQPNVWMQHSV
ncbi:MAG: hypothetical protein KDD04_01535 [Sinomicrobium sp.]|nr:hypothetical protein [Sinomicrobium sp.]